MQKIFSLLFVVVLITSAFAAKAIDPPTKSKADAATGIAVRSAVFSNAIYQDFDANKVYIDFDEIPINLKHVNLLDGNGQVLFSQDVYNLPVSGLFEIDLSAYQSDLLILEIESFVDTRFVRLGGVR